MVKGHSKNLEGAIRSPGFTRRRRILPDFPLTLFSFYFQTSTAAFCVFFKDFEPDLDRFSEFSENPLTGYSNFYFLSAPFFNRKNAISIWIGVTETSKNWNPQTFSKNHVYLIQSTMQNMIHKAAPDRIHFWESHTQLQ